MFVFEEALLLELVVTVAAPLRVWFYPCFGCLSIYLSFLPLALLPLSPGVPGKGFYKESENCRSRSLIVEAT